MIRKLFITLLPIVAIAIFTGEQMSDNGKAGKTGSPGEIFCTDCHNTYSLNSGGGSILLQSPGMTGFQYTPGQTYNMSVTVARTGNSLFGIGLEALTSTNDNAGSLTITDAASTAIKNATVSGVSRKNIVHKLNGGASADSKVFSFSWTAPAAGTGNVTFYYAGAACNGNGSDKGDYVYASSQVITEAPTCTTAPSQPAAISGNSSTCSGSSVTYTVPTVVDATSYIWTLPGGWTGTSTLNSITVTSGTTSGTISVAAVNACGTSPASSMAVSISTLTATITPNGGVLQASAGTSYEWYLDGTFIPGAISSTYTPVLDGNYVVVVYDGTGCFGTSAPYYYSAVGINNISGNNKQLSVFPNPSSSVVTVNAPEVLNNTQLLIYDITGKVVRRITLESGVNKIDVSEFTEGVYSAVAGTDGNKFISRILISR